MYFCAFKSGVYTTRKPVNLVCWIVSRTGIGHPGRDVRMRNPWQTQQISPHWNHPNPGPVAVSLDLITHESWRMSLNEFP